MEKIPTAEEFVNQYDWENSTLDIPSVLIEFAKLHVQAALEAASENAQMIGVTQHDNDAPDVHSDFVYVVDSNGPDYGYTVDKGSILNAYPLTNIK